MTWRLLTCSSLLAAIAATYPEAAAATLNGQISIQTTAKGSQAADSSGVVVWLEPQDESRSVPIRPVTRRILQKNKTFLPHVLAIPVGSTVDFPNEDPIFHNAFSNFNGQIFDIGLYAPGGSRSVVFRRPGIVRVFCNIHAAMSAVIAVLDTPYFAVSQSDGRFSISGVPPGNYQILMYHERAGEDLLRQLSKAVSMGDKDTNLETVNIVESPYMIAPHLNKYGKPYAETPTPTYGAAH